MTKKELCVLFTNKVMEYINNGYVISPDSFAGSDGTSRVDLVKDKMFIRVYMEDIYDKGNNILAFRVWGKELSDREAKNIYNQDIVWTNDLTVIEESKFVVLNKYDRNPYYVTEEEYDVIRDKIKERRTKNERNFFGHKYISLPESAKSVVLPFIKRQPKCKSAKLNDITNVEKHIKDNRVEYLVSCRGKVYALH